METGAIKAVAFDVDGTLIDSHVWRQLHVLFGLPSEENERLHMLYVNGTLSFHQVTDLMGNMYLKKTPGVTKGEADAVFKNFKFKSGSEETVRLLSAKYPIAVISSGLSDFVNEVAGALNVPHVYSYTSFTYSPNGKYTGIAYNDPDDELQAKVNALKDFGLKVGVKPEEIVFVGDSINDLAAFRHTGRGILVGDGTTALQEAAWQRVTLLPEILSIL
jgi:HAD superfamily phosphoserine phosphatase-like hydrolase